jgi:two-component system phosphate regulon response regulator PhoB
LDHEWVGAVRYTRQPRGDCTIQSPKRPRPVRHLSAKQSHISSGGNALTSLFPPRSGTFSPARWVRARDGPNKGYAETVELAIKDDPDAAVHFMAQIRSQCLRLERLISDMMQLAKAQSGRGQMNLSPVSLQDLIVEDYRPLAETLDYQLGRAGYEVSHAADGRDALTQAKLILPDVVLLDVDLPILNGIEVCKQLRANPATKDMLILMLSALGEESDQVVGFAIGADDYVVKPVESYKVLLQRLKALLRRREPSFEDNEQVNHHGVMIDRRRFVATVNDQPLKLTKSEFKLLETLIRQPGRAFGRAELVDAALGEDTMVLDRTIDVHVRALRKKMGDAADLIETVRGVGYRFRE